MDHPIVLWHTVWWAGIELPSRIQGVWTRPSKTHHPGRTHRPGPTVVRPTVVSGPTVVFGNAIVCPAPVGPSLTAPCTLPDCLVLGLHYWNPETGAVDDSVFGLRPTLRVLRWFRLI